jgi:SPASM domain peptide maturase of grasp-with-spasm system
MISISSSIIESVQFIIPYSNETEAQNIIQLIYKYPRIRFVQMYNAPENNKIYSNEIGSVTVITVENNMENHLSCGIVSRSYFSIATSTFTESQHHNTCLNRKISIDVNGNIKNCPSMSQSYGNIKDTTLMEAIEQPNFKQYWDITKDKIHVCKDCEFRHICTDCRAYVEAPEDIFSKPLKCGYNPYTGEWSEWSTNPLKQKAIEHYGLREIVDIAG